MHMIRSTNSSTIISYQPESHRQGTTAKNVHDRVFLAGQSVYWNKLLRASNDPTFVLLIMFWYACYAWDQAFEMLWEHICRLVCLSAILVIRHNLNLLLIIRNLTLLASGRYNLPKNYIESEPIFFIMPPF